MLSSNMARYEKTLNQGLEIGKTGNLWSVSEFKMNKNKRNDHCKSINDKFSSELRAWNIAILLTSTL